MLLQEKQWEGQLRKLKAENADLKFRDRQRANQIKEVGDKSGGCVLTRPTGVAARESGEGHASATRAGAAEQTDLRQARHRRRQTAARRCAELRVVAAISTTRVCSISAAILARHCHCSFRQANSPHVSVKRFAFAAVSLSSAVEEKIQLMERQLSEYRVKEREWAIQVVLLASRIAANFESNCTGSGLPYTDGAARARGKRAQTC